ncbi:unnamed protein product [Malus baccata var. baccata]
MAVEQLKIGREQGVFSRVDDEILQNILGRLPGVEFSSAVGVNANWNKNFGQMLSRPKFSSALSLKPDLHVNWAQGNSPRNAEAIHRGIVVSVNWAQGNSARNTETIHRGIVVSVGYVPCLRVEVFPLASPGHVSFVAMLRSMGYGDFILVDGVGIQPDDVLFFFYHSDAITALNTIGYASDNLQTFVHNDSEIQPEMFGGFIFSSKKRDASMFNRPNVDCKPFADNFPVVPVAGMFGNKEIACSGLLGEEEDQELGHPRYVHACSSMYLAMTYVPPQAPYYLKE